MGQQLGVPMGLPTEAQWEYAARNRGKLVVYATDNGKIEEGRNVASYDQTEAYGEKHDDGRSAPMPVGLYPPNALGLYDVVADAFEWTADWYSDSAYKHAAKRDPKGPALGKERVLRGCSNVESLANVCMTFARFHSEPQVSKSDEMVQKGWNPNRGHAARCVVNSPTPVPKE